MVESQKNNDTLSAAPTTVRRSSSRRLLLAGLLLVSLVSGFFSSYSSAPARIRPDRDGSQEFPAQADNDAPRAVLDTLQLPTSPPADSEELQAELLPVMGQLVASYSDDPETYSVMARLQALLGHTAEEEKYWRLCLERDPKHTRALKGLEALAARQGEPPPAGQPAADFRAMSEKGAELYTYAAHLHALHGDNSMAESLWQRATLLAPRDINCRQALAYHYLQQQKPLKTISLLGQLAELEPENSTYTLEIARLNLSLNRFSAAEKALQELCQRSPDDPSGFAALAELYLRANRKSQESLALAQTAVKLAPTVANYVILAGAHERNGDLPGALAALESALRLEPGNQQYQQMQEQLKKKLRSLEQR